MVKLCTLSILGQTDTLSLTSRGMCPVLWSTTGNFYDRENAKMYDDELKNLLTGVLDTQKAAA